VEGLFEGAATLSGQGLEQHKQTNKTECTSGTSNQQGLLSPKVTGREAWPEQII